MKTARGQVWPFFFRVAVLGLPAAAMLVFYVVTDPFRVLRSYDDYYTDNPITTNRDWVSTTLYQRAVERSGYDAFVFGSSRSLAFTCTDWVGEGSSHRCFHFDAWAETLFGIWGKVKYIHEHGFPLRKALLLVDASVLRTAQDSDGHLFRKHPDISRGSMVAFQAESLTAFFTDLFLFKYADFRLTGRVRTYTRDVVDDHAWHQRKDTNDLAFTAYDEAIAREGEGYWASRPGMFERGEPSVDAPVVGDVQRTLLADMARMFKSRGTDVRVVVAPLLDRKKMAEADLRELISTFGADVVEDYSGANAYTNDIHHYYDNSHFRPEIGRAILATKAR